MNFYLLIFRNRKKCILSCAQYLKNNLKIPSNIYIKRKNMKINDCYSTIITTILEHLPYVQNFSTYITYTLAFNY